MTNYEAGLAAGRADGVEALRKMSQKLAEITADRDEWKQQHENLLAMYQAQTAELAALKQPRMETAAVPDPMSCPHCDGITPRGVLEHSPGCPALDVCHECGGDRISRQSEAAFAAKEPCASCAPEMRSVMAGGKGADATTAATEPVSRPASPPSTETRPIPMGGQHAAPPCFFCGHHLDKHAYNALGHPWRAGAAVTVADLALNR